MSSPHRSLDETSGQDMTTRVTIASRFCGPPPGNGGYCCGLAAAGLRGAVEVTLRRPPPLDRALRLERDHRVVLRDGDDVVAEARQTCLALDVPHAPSFEAAEAMSRRFTGFAHHHFPTCFVCGPARAPGDGLRIFPGGAADNGLVGAPWIPDRSLASAGGRPEFLWAALNCPGYFAVASAGQKALLGRMAAGGRSLQTWLTSDAVSTWKPPGAAMGRTQSQASSWRDASQDRPRSWSARRQRPAHEISDFQPTEGRAEVMGSVIAFVYGVVAYAMFFVTFLYAAGFVGNIVVPKSLDGAPVGPVGTSLLIDLGLLGLFVVQHSTMARPGFKRLWMQIVPQPVERSTYVLASSLALILLFWQWRPLGGVVWDIEDPVGRALLHTGFAFGWLLVLVTTFLINHFDLFGLRQVWLHLCGRPYQPLPFKTPGPYRLVRHPLYVGWLFAFWSTPTMTVTHLVFALATTAYIPIAIRFEERDLLDVHPEYAAYRNRVPMLLPVGRRTDPDTDEADLAVGR